MTGIAIVRGIGVIARFAGGNATVMAAHARTNHLIMIQRRDKRQPGIRGGSMASFTQVGRIRMIAGFAGGNTTVMTTHASTNDFVVVQRCNEG